MYFYHLKTERSKIKVLTSSVPGLCSVSASKMVLCCCVLERLKLLSFHKAEEIKANKGNSFHPFKKSLIAFMKIHMEIMS